MAPAFNGTWPTGACVWWMMMCRPNVRDCCLLVFKCCLRSLLMQPAGRPELEV